MRRFKIILFVLLTLPSCQEEVIRVTFRVKAEGFTLSDALLDSDGVFSTFTHRVSGGIVKFTNGDDMYSFDLENVSIDDFEFQLPPGEYEMELIIPPASLYGQKGGSFTSSPGKIIITETTETSPVKVVANCSLFLVWDEMDQLEDGIYMIERHSYANGYFISHPLFLDSLSNLRYAYFTPDTDTADPSAFLWFYSGMPGREEGGLPTSGFEIGTQYHIRILE